MEKRIEEGCRKNEEWRKGVGRLEEGCSKGGGRV